MKNLKEGRGIKINVGMSFTTLLTLSFIILKLTHVINWAWWIVLAPLWIGLALAIFVSIVLAIIAVVINKFC